MEQEEKVVISKSWAALWVRHHDALGRSKLSDPFRSSHRTRTDPGRHRPSFRDGEKSNEPRQWNCEYDDHGPRRSAPSSVTRKNQRVPLLCSPHRRSIDCKSLRAAGAAATLAVSGMAYHRR